jgi:hypothetical protein
MLWNTRARHLADIDEVHCSSKGRLVADQLLFRHDLDPEHLDGGVVRVVDPLRLPATDLAAMEPRLARGIPEMEPLPPLVNPKEGDVPGFVEAMRWTPHSEQSDLFEQADSSLSNLTASPTRYLSSSPATVRPAGYVAFLGNAGRTPRRGGIRSCPGLNRPLGRALWPAPGRLLAA